MNKSYIHRIHAAKMLLNIIAQLCTGRYIRDECMYIAAEYGMNYVTPLTKWSSLLQYADSTQVVVTSSNTGSITFTNSAFWGPSNQIAKVIKTKLCMCQ